MGSAADREATWRRILGVLHEPVALFDRTGRILRQSPAFRRLAGEGAGAWEPALGALFHDLRTGEQREDVVLTYHAGAGRPPRPFRASLHAGEEDVIVALRPEGHRQVLLEEMGHRIANVLETVKSVASRTMSRSRSLREFASAFEDRLLALGRAHSLLTQGNWKGAHVADLVEAALAPYGGHAGDQVRRAGPPILLAPRSALALHLVLHELATNAAKHGALATAGGHIDIAWRLEGPDVRLAWRETGVAGAVEPTEEGFGLHLLRTHIPYELGGETRLRFEAAGVVCEMSFPANAPGPGPANGNETP